MFSEDTEIDTFNREPTPFERFLDNWWVRLFMIVAATCWFALLAIGYPAGAADLKAPPVLKAAPVPVIQNYSFYVGAFGGAGLTSGLNEFSAFSQSEALAITQVNTGVVRGYPTSPFAGATIGYTQNLGAMVIDFSADGAYDFARGCITQDCTTARKDGWLMEQGIGIGLNLATLNGLQPIPLPSPSGVPASVWSSLILMGRGGMEERTLNLCQFAVTTVTPDGSQFAGDTLCGSKIIAAPFAGAEFTIKATPQTAFFAKWSHVWWGKQYQLGIDTTGLGGLAASQSLQRISNEDIFRVGFKYFLF